MTKQITLRLPEELHRALKEMSEKTGLSIHSLVLIAVNYRVGIFGNKPPMQ